MRQLWTKALLKVTFHKQICTIGRDKRYYLSPLFLHRQDNFNFKKGKWSFCKSRRSSLRGVTTRSRPPEWLQNFLLSTTSFPCSSKEDSQSRVTYITTTERRHGLLATYINIHVFVIKTRPPRLLSCWWQLQAPRLSHASTYSLLTVNKFQLFLKIKLP